VGIRKLMINVFFLYYVRKLLHNAKSDITAKPISALW